MCYEYGSWFRKTREKETREFAKKGDEARRTGVPAPVQPAENRDTRAREPEKTPA
jgi:hypothetical protein